MKPYLKFALLTSAVIIIWTMIQYLTGLDRSDTGKYLSWISYPIMAVFIVMAIKEEKNLGGGYLSFGEGFKTGMMMMTVVAVIMSVFTYLYFSIINPEFLEFVADKAYDDMENRGMSDAEIEQAMGYAKMFMGVGFMTGAAFIGNIIIGAIMSLIAAAILKKEKPAIS